MGIKNMIIAIQQPEHAPWLGFFDKMSKVGSYVLLDNVQFKKRYFENRNKIRTASGWQWITVPVISKARYTQKINEVVIDNTQKWRRKYLNSLKHAYAGAVHFASYYSDIATIINYSWGKLANLNIEIISFLREVFNLTKIPMIKASSLKLSKESTGSELILEICEAMGTKTYMSGPDGMNYLKLSNFAPKGIDVVFHNYIHPMYNQIHSPFLSHMSVFDFLFNCGGKSFNKIGK